MENLKTIVKISNDYGFSFAYESKVEDINYPGK